LEYQIFPWDATFYISPTLSCANSYLSMLLAGIPNNLTFGFL
jgi:hypothetical protein